MATLVLQYAGQALGGMVGGPVGAAIGRAAGAVIGNMIDSSLLSKPADIEGPRLDDLQVQASSEGAPIPRCYGRTRLSGQVIWATRFEEQISTTTSKSGGKGGSSSRKAKITEYSYYANFAIALAEGEIGRVARIWADGKPLDHSALTMRVYTGSQDQLPDSLISAKEGAGNAPAYRGLAYIVFERMPIAAFGNRIPQLTFEIFSPLDDMETRISGVNIIPGSTEFGYHTAQIISDLGSGITAAENTHSYESVSDWTSSMDDLAASCPNLKSASLVVAWFGDDLRCGVCNVKPGVEVAVKTTRPGNWSVSGISRANAHLVSLSEGVPAFGGTPSDASIVAAIKDIKARGWRAVFYPFLLMDIPDGNTLPDPYSGAAGQPVYPWRGRISCDPAPGVPGTVDKTAEANAQVSAFFGTATAADFVISGENVIYSGPDEWSLRRMVLHYAHLCKAAGGVDAFLIASELKSLSIIRDSAAHFPAIDAFVALAAEVRSVLGPETKISYAADWSEYFGYHPADGTGDVFFHLDPFWASADVDFIGIDNYAPIADWRDGKNHLDYLAGWKTPYDTAYLRSQIAGGEGYEWYYTDQSARDAQNRIPITDGAYAKPWVFRHKDLKNWWSNAHYDRPGGIENAAPTPWMAQSKPIWFTETGCPAIDKGANQPNVFVDAKSSESARPHYSTGARDDLMQRRYLKAILQYWDRQSEQYSSGSNPVSNIYSLPMVDIDNVHIWAWDARPFPAFPLRDDIWADAPNWQYGHWLNGRLGAAPLDALVHALAAGSDADVDASSLEGLVDGYVIDRPLSARQAIEPLALGYFFDTVESGDIIRFSHRKDAPIINVSSDDFVIKSEKSPAWNFTRAQETELPASVRLSYIDLMAGYRSAAVEARRQSGQSARAARAELPLVMEQSTARRMAETWLQESWCEREKAKFSLPPALLALEPGDVVNFSCNSRNHQIRISEITDALGRELQGSNADHSLYNDVPAVARTLRTPVPKILGPVKLEFLDLPLLTGTETPHAGFLAAFANPWPGAVAVYRGPDDTAYDLNTVMEAPAAMGETLWDFYSGPTACMDYGNRLQLRLYGGALQSVDELNLLAGANIAAVAGSNNEWEIFQFSSAELVASDTYELSGLLRAQAGTESAMADPVAAGARFVLLNGALQQLDMSADEIGLAFNYRYGPYTRDMGDAVYQDSVVTFSGAGLKPLSPVHIHARRDASSMDIDITWLRRTRLNGDSWVLEDVPLAEESEVYEVNILDAGDAILRSTRVTSPIFTYTSAMQTADFGSNPAQITVEIAQISASYGAGSIKRAALHL